MTTYARVIGNIAVELFIVPEGFTLEECFHEELHSEFIEVSETLKVGATLANNVWTNPTPPAVESRKYPLLPPVQFYLGFTVEETIAIKASNDAAVKEFFARYELAERTDTLVNPNQISVQEGLEYLLSVNILKSLSRIEQISLGVPQ